METNNTHIGNLINELLAKQHKTKRALGDAIGMSHGQAVYLTTRKSIDVLMLQKIGEALGYNFFYHYPIENKGTWNNEQVISDKKIKQEEEENKLQEKITELEKQLEECKKNFGLQKQENGFLKEINELLKANQQKENL